ncbi:MAG: hypothetical protein IKU44_05130, partial [Firmicutes bacterium]|nr:hypothetical protein [Bacillota bacterium]
MGGLMMIIAFCTVYTLILPAITMQEDIWCGKEVHLHEETCYQSNLICTVADETEGHVHIEECYEQVQICTMEEHEHEDICYVDPNGEPDQEGETEEGVIEETEPDNPEDAGVPEGGETEGEPEEGTADEIAPEDSEVAEEEVAEGDEAVQQDLGTVEKKASKALAASARATTATAGKYGNYTLSLNEMKDAFTKDATYAKYYSEDSPLGVAGSFHLVAFDTATLYTHTNGNILAHTLRANTNFGTNNYPDELSYVVNYQQVHSTSASRDNHVLVVGSENQVTVGGNKDILYVNSVKLDRPRNLVQDVDSAKTPFIDLTNVNIEIAGISSQLASAADQGVAVSFGDQNNRSIRLSNPNSVGVYSIKASQLNQYSNNPMKLMGFTKDGNGSMIINVD